MKKPLVVFVLPSLEEVSPVKAALIVANSYVSAGFDVTLISLKSKFDSQVFVPSSIAVKYVGVGSWLYFPFYLKSLKLILLDLNPIFCMSYLLPADLMVGLCGVSVRKVSNVRDVLETSLASSYAFLSGRFTRSLIKSFQFYYLSKFDEVVVMTQDMFYYYDAVKNASFRLIHNFIDEGLTSDMSNKIPEDSLSEELPSVIVVGSLIPRKSIAGLLDITEYCWQRGLKFNLYLLGDGPLKSDLLAKKKCLVLSSKYVHFLGYINNPMPLVKQADVFVINSSSEGLSRAMLESAYLGTPCLIRDIMGVSEFASTSSGIQLFTNKSQFYTRLTELLSTRETVRLNEKYREADCLDRYKELALYYC